MKTEIQIISSSVASYLAELRLISKVEGLLLMFVSIEMKIYSIKADI